MAVETQLNYLAPGIDRPDARPRESIEVRTLAFFPD